MITPLLIATIGNCIVIDPYCIGLHACVEAGERMSSKSLMEVMASFLIQKVIRLFELALIHLLVSKGFSFLSILNPLLFNILINQTYFYLSIMIPFSLLTFSLNFSSLRCLLHIPFIIHLFSTHTVFMVVQISFLIEKLMSKIAVIASFMEEICLIHFYSLAKEDFLVEEVTF